MRGAGKNRLTAMGDFELELGDLDAIEAGGFPREDEDEGLRQRIVARQASPPPPLKARREVPSPRPAPDWDRVDREERCYSTIVAIALICGIALIVFAHRFVLSFRPPAPPQLPSSLDRFVYLDYARVPWATYLANRTRCAQPTREELEVWRASGEVCDGTCLRVGDVLDALARRAAVVGEAYSSMGRAARGAPVPCALATKDDGGNVTAYLAPRLASTSGRAYRAAIEVPFFGGELREAPAHQVAIVEHVEWPSGERVRVRTEGIAAAQWSAALFVLNPD